MLQIAVSHSKKEEEEDGDEEEKKAHSGWKLSLIFWLLEFNQINKLVENRWDIFSSCDS